MRSYEVTAEFGRIARCADHFRCRGSGFPRDFASNRFNGIGIQFGGCCKRLQNSTGPRRNVPRKFKCQTKLFDGYQFVYVWQSKFQSIPLCAVDAQPPRLLASSLLYEEGVYETKTDFEVDIIGRGGSPVGSARLYCAITCPIWIGSRHGRSDEWP